MTNPTTELPELKIKSSTDENRLLFGTYNLQELLSGFTTVDGKEALGVLADIRAQAEAAGVRKERARLVEVTKKWRKSHHPDSEGKWHIQNLLGDFFGWGGVDQQEISSLFDPTIEETGVTIDELFREIDKIPAAVREKLAINQEKH